MTGLNRDPPEAAHVIKYFWCLGSGKAAPCLMYPNVPVFSWPSILNKSLSDITMVKCRYPPSVPPYSVASPSESSSSLSSLSGGLGVCVPHSLGSSLLLTVAFPVIAVLRCSSCFWVGPLSFLIYFRLSSTCFRSPLNYLI